MNLRDIRGVVLRVLEKQEARFILIGAANTTIGYLLFIFVVMAVETRVGATLCLVISYCIALPISFSMQRVFVFRASGRVLPQFVRFCIANSSIFFANLVFLPVAIALTEGDSIIVQGVFVVASAVVSFFAHKHFSFGHSA